MKSDSLQQFRERPTLRHLKRLTSKDGLFQHADFDVPDPSFGYSIDDNARGLIACIWHYKIFQDLSVLQLGEVYFRYLQRAAKDDGNFHNFLGFLDQKLDDEGSEDSAGRAIWALGEAIGEGENSPFYQEAKQIFDRAQIAKHLNHSYLRTKAYLLLGLLSAGAIDESRPWAKKLVEGYEKSSSPTWNWFEDGLYYANGIFPYALARAALAYEDNHLKKIAVETYWWLDSISRDENSIPTPIGQDGWYKKGESKALYDQQPVETADMILAATALYRLTGDKKFIASALEWYGWYKNNNTHKRPLINQATGGIYDAITQNGVNENQGAESIVTYLMAYLQLTALANVND